MKYKPDCPYCAHKFHWSDATKLDIQVGTYYLCPNCGKYVVWSVTVYPPNRPPSWGKPIPYNLEIIRRAIERCQ